MLNLLMSGLVAVMLAVGLSESCPVDELSSYFTGRTEIVSGRLMKEYRCSRGHRFWVRAS